MRLAISIPVHERLDCVVDQAENIRRFVPGALIVFHVSSTFNDFDESPLVLYPEVHINPERCVIEHGKGLLHAHVSNFRYLDRLGLAFDTYCLASSNELFFRSGVAEYVREAGVGVQCVPADPQHDWHLFARRIESLAPMRMLLERLNVAKVFGGQAEGQFYPRELFRSIAELYQECFGAQEPPGFESEEVVPQTIIATARVSYSLPFTLVDYTHFFEPKADLFAALRDPRRRSSGTLHLGPKRPLCLASPHAYTVPHSVFAFKRVPREYDHPLRAFIRSLPD